MPVFEGSLKPEDSRTIRVYELQVPAGTREIVIDLSYNPRTVEDRGEALTLVQNLLAIEGSQVPAEQVLTQFWPLRNLLNVVAFDPRGRFRGRWDRNRPEQRSAAVIAEQGSSPGMVDDSIPAGMWQLCLEIHQVLTPLKYTLRIDASDEIPGLVTPGLRAPGSGPVVSGSPEMTGDWVKGDLHVHTEHSDGRQPVAEVVSALMEEGLDFFALTDHNTTTGLRDLPDGGLLTLPGFELTTFWGHATCLGLSEFVPWYDGARPRPLRQIAAEVRAAGGLVCVAHPFSPPNPLCAGCQWEFPGFDWEDADLLEIWNGDQHEHAAINAAALELWDRLLNAGRRIWGVAGSDMHDLQHLKTKRYARTLLRVTERSTGGILRALRAGKIVVTSGPALAMRALVRRRPYDIGETVRVRAGETVTVQGSAHDAPADVQTRMVVGGSRNPVPLRWTHVLRADQPTWVRAEVVAGSTVLALTNPIFIDVIRDS